LASGGSRQLGVVFGTSSRFQAELLDGLYVAAKETGYELILSALTPSRDERTAVETLLDFRCEAVILLGLGHEGVPVLAGRLPLTVIGWRVADPSVDVVRTSDDQGMRHAVDHLVALGHRVIAHVDGGSGPVSAARRRGYRAAMRRHGLDAHIRVLPGGDSIDVGVRVGRPLLETQTLPTAVTCYNDEIAAGLLEALAPAGIQVPRDISIIGWDDGRLARLPHLNLTTVRQDAVEMTRLAVDRSIARLRGEPVARRELVLSPELIVRTSTAPSAHSPAGNVGASRSPAPSTSTPES
jgi:DNA-binding LacI/PurR family transcriptional regulator